MGDSSGIFLEEQLQYENMVSSQYFLQGRGQSSKLFGFEEIMNNIYDIVEKIDSGAKSNIAIIGEPFSGRTELLYKVSDLCQGRESKLFFSSIVRDDMFLRTLEKSGDIVLVDNCQLLYSRTIGGFETLNLFLKSVVSSNKLFITTWNYYSWNYLRFIYPLEKIFPISIQLPGLDSEEIKKMIKDKYDVQMTFAEEEDIKKKQRLVLYGTLIDLNFFGKSVKISVPMINYSELKTLSLDKFRSPKQKEENSIEDKVFQRLKDASEGNPGIAKAIWEKSINRSEGVIKPGDIIKPQHEIDLAYDQSYLLYTILCMESITIEELEKQSIEANVDQFVHHLEKSGLIFIDKGLVRIVPEALHGMEIHAKSQRLVF